MQSVLSNDLLNRWQEEYAKRKNPKGIGLNPNGGIAPNPDNSNAPSRDLPMRGSKTQEKRQNGQKPDSVDQGKKPNINDMQWQLGYALEPILDEHTGLAKWPLSFKRLSKDVKQPLATKPSTKPGNAKPEQPPTAV